MKENAESLKKTDKLAHGLWLYDVFTRFKHIYWSSIL
jgi:hypothetical protein